MEQTAEPEARALHQFERKPFQIPGGSSPVEIATLHEDKETGARTTAVWFPPGWSRASTGWYSAAEEVFVVEGALEMNGEVIASGQWVYYPAGFERRATHTPDGALALAHFDGPPRWHEGART